jgi:hypothetical protein
MPPEETTEALTIVQPTALEAVERASIDVQIATAKRYPRDVKKAKKDMIEMALLDEETAKACSYEIPRAGKIIEGGTIRLAEIALAAYGNATVLTRVIANDGKTITVQGVARDLEKNIAVSVEVQGKITDKKGRVFSEDMQVVTANALRAKALRNAVFKIIPRAIIESVRQREKKVAVGDQKTLAQRRDAAIASFKSLGIKPEEVLSFLGRKTASEIDLDDMGKLAGTFTAIRDEEMSLDDFRASLAKPVEPSIVAPADAQEAPEPSGDLGPADPGSAVTEQSEGKEPVSAEDPPPAPETRTEKVSQSLSARAKRRQARAQRSAAE